VSIQLVFEIHATTVDNEQDHATGWRPGRLSARGRVQARELGARRRHDGLAGVFSSDLRRATETVSIAFGGSGLPLLYDWRLRECDYGRCSGMPAAELNRRRRDHLDQPYPDGESWRQAVARAGRFLGDLPLRWEEQRVLVVGHVATRWALDHFILGTALDELTRENFSWRAGWEYVLT
jgi:2,3-bisphosphoglycerate-dependent phosphoglycerate mutase